jgi:acetate kinase
MSKSVLAVNFGSSSLKASFFERDGWGRKDFRYEGITSHREAIDHLLFDLGDSYPDIIGHRIVHGGNIKDQWRVVDDAEHDRLRSLVHLAPLHMPANILGYVLCEEVFNVPHIACYDTAFHATIGPLATRLPIPKWLGIKKYGFHGLSYAHIANELPHYDEFAKHKNIIVAHLGSGSSLCMLKNLKSVETTMGYTPAGGVCMGTRPGDLDPGVMLELTMRYDTNVLSDLIYNQCGLLALSGGESADMSELIFAETPAADFAINYYCREVQGAIGSLAAKWGGVDAIVFTGGIGENSGAIRELIMEGLGFLYADTLVIPTNEEETIRRYCDECTSK